MAEKTEAYLARMKDVSPDNVAECFLELENLYANKLWNQVAELTLKLVSDKYFADSIDLKDFYDNFIHEYQHRINVLRLVEIIVPVANYLFDKARREDAFTFLATFERAASKSDEAIVRLRTAQIALRLRVRGIDEVCEDIGGIRKMLEETKEQLDRVPGVTRIHAPFYKVSAAYQKEVGDHAGYYREALRYLGCEDLDALSEEGKRCEGIALAHAAMLGINVYNFGELLSHPILKSLEGPQDKFLLELLYSFNSGDLAKFQKHEARWSMLPHFKELKATLEEKVRLLCLMEMTMAHSSKHRHIGFDEIALKAQIPVDRVEFLVMKALSNNLINGSIDQVGKTVHVSWVQPRVLSSEQIAGLAGHISALRKDVETMELLVKHEAKDIIVES